MALQKSNKKGSPFEAKKDMIKVRKDVNTIVEFFDNEYLDLRKRVERIETHLDLPPIN